jgi:putative oxidoreductase
MVSSLGLFVARAIVGLSLASHGAQKQLGWFGGPGPQGAAQFFESIGFAPGDQHVSRASISEMTAGTLMALGLGGPIGPGLALSVMTVAMSVSAEKGFYGQNGGLEFPMLYALSAMTFGATGYGPLSLDHALGLEKPLGRAPLFWLAITAGVAAGLVTASNRRVQAEGP